LGDGGLGGGGGGGGSGAGDSVGHALLRERVNLVGDKVRLVG
jgi:hypothetical protein